MPHAGRASIAGVDDPPITAPSGRHPRVRTFHARHGRVNETIRRALRDLGPRYALARRRRAGHGLVLEVGAGHGEAALAFARSHPHLDVVATEVHSPGVAHLLQDLVADDPGNLSVVAGDALELLDHHLVPGELAGVHLFFPDPWPKVRHHKRRFVRPDVLDLLAGRMAPAADLVIATDVDDYASWARRHLDEHRAFTGGPAPRPSWRPVTGYEAKAMAAGRTITELRYRRG